MIVGVNVFDVSGYSGLRTVKRFLLFVAHCEHWLADNFTYLLH